MDIRITNKSNRSWEVVYVSRRSGSCSVNIESVRLFRRFGGGRYRQKKCRVLCCKVIDACTTSNDV